jgi:hypothetical protein
MGKNPNAKKLKEKKHRERTYSNNVEDIEEEASRRGMTVLELQEERDRLNRGSSSGSDQDGSDEEQQPKQIQKKKQPAKEEVKKAPVQ